MATSTPHESSNSHSSAGSLTRAITLSTPYSVFDRSEMTRLALSSPVAATTTSASPAWARCSVSGSQASARIQSASGTEAIFMAEGCLSTIVMSWPACVSSLATDRPTDPAPAMTTFITRPPSPDGWRCAGPTPPDRRGR